MVMTDLASRAKRSAVASLALLALATTALYAQDATQLDAAVLDTEQAVAVPAAKEFTAAGDFSVREEAPLVASNRPRPLRTLAGNKRWQASVARDKTGALRGRISAAIGDTSVLTQGTVHGQSQGSTMWGEIVDDAGRQLATFEVHVANGAYTGRFTTSDHETGTFSFDPPVE